MSLETNGKVKKPQTRIKRIGGYLHRIVPIWSEYNYK